MSCVNFAQEMEALIKAVLNVEAVVGHEVINLLFKAIQRSSILMVSLESKEISFKVTTITNHYISRAFISHSSLGRK